MVLVLAALMRVAVEIDVATHSRKRLGGEVLQRTTGQLSTERSCQYLCIVVTNVRFTFDSRVLVRRLLIPGIPTLVELFECSLRATDACTSTGPVRVPSFTSATAGSALVEASGSWLRQ